MTLMDAGVGRLADQTVNDIAQNAVDSYTAWEKETFALGGLVNTVIYAAIVAAAAFIIIKLIQHFLARKLTGNARIFYRLIYVAIIIIAILCVLVTIKPLGNLGTGLLASSGIAGIVIGLAAQQTLGNVFSGISISAAKPFEVGEFIEILNVTPPVMGVVKDIGLRHTTILDASNKSIVIPNSIIDKDMIRASHEDPCGYNCGPRGNARRALGGGKEQRDSACHRPRAGPWGVCGPAESICLDAGYILQLSNPV